MKHFLFLIACTFFITMSSYGQQDPPVVQSNSSAFHIVEKMPKYPGGNDALSHFISVNLKYPKKAINNGTTGRVYIRFVVDRGGSVTKVTVLRGIGDGCDEEAVRVVKSMPKWEPGTQRGKAVNVMYTLPISFKLEKQKRSKRKRK